MWQLHYKNSQWHSSSPNSAATNRYVAQGSAWPNRVIDKNSDDSMRVRDCFLNSGGNTTAICLISLKKCSCSVQVSVEMLTRIRM